MAQLIVEGELKSRLQTRKLAAASALNKFITPLKNMEVFEREDVELKCETKDTKTPGLWSRNGKAISSMPGGKFETQSRAGNHQLKISKIEMVEADIYEIDVAGLRGSCRVTVLEAERKPVINWKQQKINAEAGKEKRIKVPFEVKGTQSGVIIPCVRKKTLYQKEKKNGARVAGTRRGDPKPVLLRNGKPLDLDKMKGEANSSRRRLPTSRLQTKSRL